MSRDTLAYDGHKRLIGADSSEDFLEDRSLYSGLSVNRQYRGGWNRTRPPFHSLFLHGDEEVLEKLKGDVVVSGAFGFDGIRSQPHIILAVDDSIIKLRLSGQDAVASFLYQGWGGGLRHTFFEQAETSLFIQNLRDTPLFWDGFSDTAELIDSSFKAPDDTLVTPMPIGGPMQYAHSRMFVTDANDIVWVSDPLYGRGLVNAERNLANFSEGTYPVSGGGFTAPGGYGPITGITVIPKHPNLNGHGPVLVFNARGIWAIDPTKAPRNEWVDRTDLTETVLAGRGNASPHSIIAVNNDIWFRSKDGTIASIKHSILKDRNQWGDKSLSREVHAYLEQDAPSLLQYSYAVKGKNRALFTTGLRNGYTDSIGKARFAEGIVSIDFDPGSTIKSRHEFAWDGVWTGLNVAACFSIEENGDERVIFVSQDSDRQVRLYDLKDGSQTNDSVNGKSVQIEGFYTVKNNFLTPNPEREDFAKRIEDIEFEYDLAYGETFLEALFKPELYPYWTKILDKKKLSCSCSYDKLECGNIPHPGFGEFKAADIPKDKFDERTKSILTESSSFDFLVKTFGVLRVRKAVISATIKRERRQITSHSTCDNPCDYTYSCNEPDNIYSYKIV